MRASIFALEALSQAQWTDPAVVGVRVTFGAHCWVRKQESDDRLYPLGARVLLMRAPRWYCYLPVRWLAKLAGRALTPEYFAR